MAESILSTEKRCYLCGSTVNLEDHHIIHGPLRKVAEKYGLKCYLCRTCHRDNKKGAHGNGRIDRKLKEDVQRKFEETHSHDEWMSIVGRNYL